MVDYGEWTRGVADQLLDQQMAALLGIPALVSIQEANVAMPADDRLWEAHDAIAWDQAVQDIRAEGGSIEIPFLPTFAAVLQGVADLSRVSPFSRSIIAHTAYRFSHDAHLLQAALVAGGQEDGLNLEEYSAVLEG
jgi:hypothetical protein